MRSLTRREFCVLAGGATASIATPISWAAPMKGGYTLVASTDHDRILAAANRYLSEKPITVTAFHSERSPGGPHDFYSEGDYWWPDPKNPGGPYIRRDGESNPANFNGHREAMVRLSLIVPALTAAWLLTRQKKYSDHAANHLRAWFVDSNTRMNPNLQFAQAILGINKGRGIGVIDTLHLVEVARAATLLDRASMLREGTEVRHWFADYLEWMRTSKNGQEERDAKKQSRNLLGPASRRSLLASPKTARSWSGAATGSAPRWFQSRSRRMEVSLSSSPEPSPTATPSSTWTYSAEWRRASLPRRTISGPFQPQMAVACKS